VKVEEGEEDGDEENKIKLQGLQCGDLHCFLWGDEIEIY